MTGIRAAGEPAVPHPDPTAGSDPADETPRYRVLMLHRFEHDRTSPYHTDGGFHTPECAEYVHLEVYRTDAAWRHLGVPYADQPLGIVAYDGSRSLHAIRAVICDWIRRRSDPHVANVRPEHVAVYVELRDGS